MAALFLLRLFQALIAVLEVCAGILPVRIEKHIVEVPGQIVMVGYIFACPMDRIVLS